MVGTKHQVSFSNNKHFVIGCQVCLPIREEEIKTLLFFDWFTYLTTNHKVFVFRKRDLMFRTNHGTELRKEQDIVEILHICDLLVSIISLFIRSVA